MKLIVCFNCMTELVYNEGYHHAEGVVCEGMFVGFVTPESWAMLREGKNYQIGSLDCNPSSLAIITAIANFRNVYDAEEDTEG